MKKTPDPFSDPFRLEDATEAFVAAADDIAGMNSAAQVAERLTLVKPSGQLVDEPLMIIEFNTPVPRLASPIRRTTPGFIEGPTTQGGAREFVVPNYRLDQLSNVTTRIVH